MESHRVNSIMSGRSPPLHCTLTLGFKDWGGRGYDDFVPGEVTKTVPSGDESI